MSKNIKSTIVNQMQEFTHNNIDVLKQHVCLEPIYRMHIFNWTSALCCGHWNSVKMPDWRDRKTEKQLYTIKELWFHPTMEEFRQTVIKDKTYKYCNPNQCPYLGNPDMFMTKNDNHEYIKKWENGEFFIPELCYDVDNSCQLKCPSCRHEVLYNKNLLNEFPAIQSMTHEILDLFDKGNIKYLNMNSTGDPFISPACVYLMDHVTGIKDFSELHLHTNGLKLTKRWWDTHERLHPLVRHLQLSLDAGDKESYEKVRLGGKWETIMENIEFIGKELRKERDVDVSVNIILQKDNYKSLPKFLEISHKWDFHACISKINKWKHLSDEQFSEMAAWHPDHPEYPDFVNMIKSLLPLKDIRLSFGNLIEDLSQYRDDMK